MKNTSNFTKKAAIFTLSTVLLSGASMAESLPMMVHADSLPSEATMLISPAPVEEEGEQLVISPAPDMNGTDSASDAKVVISAEKAKLNVNVIVNKKNLKSKGFYVTYDNGTQTAMVPLKQVAKKLNMRLEKTRDKQYLLRNEDMRVSFTIGEDSYYLSTTHTGMAGASLFSLGQSPVMKKKAVYIPAEVVSSLYVNAEGFLKTSAKKIAFDTSVLTADSDNTDAGEVSTQIASPIHEFESLEALEKQVGFQINLPNGLKDLNAQYLSINADLAHIVYNDASKEIYFRQSKGNEDISGDYNEYKDVKTITVNGIDVTLHGIDGVYFLATWLDGTYSYCLGVQSGVSEAKIVGLL